MIMNRDMESRVDPELIAALKNFENFKRNCPTLSDIPGTRRMLDKASEAMRAGAETIEGVITKEIHVPGPGDAPEVAICIHQPANTPEPLPTILWIHGGGYILGNMNQDELFAKTLVKALQCKTVCVEYRLAPEHPFPAPLDDCYAVLKWIATHSAELGVDKSRIAVGGGSAGGGLAAGLALLARDRGEVGIIFQLLVQSMIDDRTIAAVSRKNPDTLVWGREDNRIGWRSYLGLEPGGKGVSPYASPCRAVNLTGLPPAFITVGELDLFLNENMDYAQRLTEAGVSTELHVYPGGYHGFHRSAPNAQVSKRCNAEIENALRRAFLRESH